MTTGSPRCFHVHEPSLNGDLDVRRLCLHRRQHRTIPCQQVRHNKPNLLHIFDGRFEQIVVLNLGTL